MRKLISILALASVAGTLVAATNGANLNGVEQETTLNCNGGPASISGVDNKVLITGNCSSLLVEGTDNEVRISISSRANINVKGTDNRIYWTGPKGTKPRVKISGVDNLVVRAK
jgi:Protein of unknown function (DUF3060)